MSQYFSITTLFLCAIQTFSGQQVDSILEKASWYCKAKQQNKAIALLKEAHHKESNNTDIPLFLAKIYAKDFKKDSSEFWLEKAEPLIDDQTSKEKAFQYYLWKGYNFDVNKNYDKALFHYFQAETIMNARVAMKDVELLYRQVLLIYSQKNYRNNAQNWILKYTRIKDSLQNDTFSNSYYNALGKHYHHLGNGREALDQFDQSIAISEKIKDSNMLNNALFHKGIVYAEHIKKQDSARFYYLKALEICNCKDHILYQRTAHYNISRTFKYENNTQQQKRYLFKTLKDTTHSRKLHIKRNVYGDLAEVYEIENRIDSAYFYKKLHEIYEDSLDQLSQEKAINELQTKYDVVQKENDLLLSNQEKVQNRNIALGLGGSLLGVSIFAFLVYKNTKRKQRIAEQGRELEIQKKEKLLKEQELNAIDAMIEGQEKERQRLASDLHDSVGATLSAAKLQFDHLAKSKDQLDSLDELFDKTGALLSQAYSEVRNMSHLKNSGVIAKNGLLPAVQKLAKNASHTYGLTIDVQDFGLTERLEGPLEISIFRIIQELVTNIIKHAQATEATISITQHEDNLSIIIEDNGQGFDIRKVVKNKGMGLSSIEHRVEHMEGSMDIDSTIGRGTHILIDIPL